MLDLNAAYTYGSGVFITNKLILGVLMQRIQRMIQIGCFSLILAFGGIGIAQASCWTLCTSNSGASVTHQQTADGWSMWVDGEYAGSGSGQYDGTICNGVSPCEVQQA